MIPGTQTQLLFSEGAEVLHGGYQKLQDKPFPLLDQESVRHLGAGFRAPADNSGPDSGIILSPQEERPFLRV